MNVPGDGDAKTDHQISEPQLRWGRAVLERMALRGDETVLDAGCRSGRHTAGARRARTPRARHRAQMLAEARVNLASRDATPCSVDDGRLNLHARR